MSVYKDLHDHRSSNGQKSAPANFQRLGQSRRKEAARRSLFDSINTRYADVNHSSSGFIVDPYRQDIKLPRVKPGGSISLRQGVICRNSISNSSGSHPSPNSTLEIQDETGNDHVSKCGKYQNGNIRRSNTNNLSLPEIIMEFNYETNANANSDRLVFATSPEDERLLGAPYEDYLKATQFSRFNPCRARYRPVTPGLLDTLNKQKLPSRVKTEQWLKTTQSLQKSINCGHQFKTENLDSSNLVFPNWIYTEF
ncbi:uncharacterized protein LOC128211091 [Mya arenaria]|uniref:uncharacterized protein LOC128211091 n=1 Tax=Mya arenaria TaxID=6604 RepID=UPI0022DEC4A6|nr:uncharacterized protein LOC128211091 [Mya arenaria]